VQNKLEKAQGHREFSYRKICICIQEKLFTKNMKIIRDIRTRLNPTELLDIELA